MAEGVAYEVRVFFLCALCGVACGIVYDLIRIIRRSFSCGTGLTKVADLLFWVLSAGLVVFVLFLANYGRIRGYEAIGLGMGAVSYFLSISPLVTDGGVRMVCIIKKLLKKVIRILLFPVFWLACLLVRPIRRILSKILRKIRKNRLTMHAFWFKIKKKMEFCIKILKK